MLGGIQLAPLITQMKVDIKSFRSDMDKVKTEAVGKAKEVSKELEGAAKVGKSMSDFGGKMTKAITLPIVGAGIAASKFQMDFESAFAGVKKTVDGTDDQLKGLENGIRGMAKEMPQAATEIAGVAEAAGQLGIEIPNILDFTKTMIMLGDSTNISSQEAAMSLAKFANITQMSQKDFDKLGSVIVELGNNTATTEQDIVSMAMRLAGAGKECNISEANIMALAASLSSVGIEAEMGGSAFSKLMLDMKMAATITEDFDYVTRITGKSMVELKQMAIHNKKEFNTLTKNIGMTTSEMNKLFKQTDRMEDFASVSGMTAQEFKKAFEKDAVGAIKAFISGLASAESKGESAIGILNRMEIKEVRLRDTLLRSANAHKVLGNAIDMSNKAWDENKALTKEASQRYETTESKLKIAKNQIVDAGMKIGEVLLPHVVSLAKNLATLAEKFSNLSPGTQEAIVKTALFAATIGPLVSIIGKTITAFAKLKPIVSGVGVVFGEGTPLVAKFLSKLGLAKTVGATTSTALASVGTAAGTAAGAGGLGALVGSLGTAVLAAAPWVAAAGAVAYGGYKIYKSMNEDVVPAVDLFADKVEDVEANWENMGKTQEKVVTKISEGTKKAVQSYLDMDKEASSALYDLKINSGKSADEIKQTLIKQFTAAGNKATDISSEMRGDFLVEMTKMTQGTDKVTKEMVDGLSDKLTKMLDNSKVLTQRQKDEIVNNFKQTWDEAKIVTDQNMNDLVDKYKAMSDKLITASNERYEREKQETIDFFAENGALTQQEQANVLKRLDDQHYLEINAIGQSRKQIEDILWKAKEQNRQITQEEFDEINRIQKEGQVKAVDILSEQEAESIVIQERLKANNNRITNEMASEQIQKANETRDKTVKAAEERYDQEVKEAAKLKKAGVINDEQYQKMVKSAEETRKSNVEKAEEMCEGVKKKIEDATPGIYTTVSKQTGEIKKPWIEIGKWVKNEWNWITGLLTQTPKLPSTPPASTGWRPNGHKYNGLNYVPKDGYIARLHKGERVLTADENKDYTQGNTSNKGVNQTLNFYGRIDSPYEVAKASKKAMIDLSFA